jgi:hypothetical protein
VSDENIRRIRLDGRTAKVFHAMKCRSIFYHLLNRQEDMMPDMADEEYDTLDELDQVSADYIRTRAEADHKLPVQIIGELVREKIAQTT